MIRSVTPGIPCAKRPDGSCVEPTAAGVLHGQASDLAFVIQGNPSDALAGFEGQREVSSAPLHWSLCPRALDHGDCSGEKDVVSDAIACLGARRSF